VWNILGLLTCTLSRACPGHPCLKLTDDLHGNSEVEHRFRIARHSEVKFTSHLSETGDSSAGRSIVGERIGDSGLIDSHLQPQEQDDFIDRVHESNASVFLLCVRCALMQRQQLLA
jgi:hypothetical protein